MKISTFFQKSLDYRQTKDYSKFMELNGWSSYITENNQYLFHRNIARTKFSLIRANRLSNTTSLAEIDALGKKINSLSTTLSFFTTGKRNEVSSYKNGFKKAYWSGVPTKTIVIGLQNNSLNKILMDMKSKTRYNIRLSETKSVVVRVFSGKQLVNSKNTLNEFYEILKKTTTRTGMMLISKHYISDLSSSFKDNLYLVSAHSSHQMIAGCLVLLSKTTAFYTHNGSLDTAKKLYSPTRIVWEAIKLAKNKNRSFFDFDGITDSRRKEFTSSWKGFTKFKEGFGGQIISFSLPFKKRYPHPFSFSEKIKLRLFSPKILPAIYPQTNIDLNKFF